MQAFDSRAEDVLRFWFRGTGRDERWFAKDPQFDAELRTRYMPLYEAAAAGALDAWRAQPRSCLALVLLLDQFPRNMFRGSAKAFDTDARALSAAKHAVASGFDQALAPVERLFLYLPFEHAESLEEQEEACRLTEPLNAFAETQDAHPYALRHREVIRRFGRFPHRNAALARESSAEELAYLATPGSGF